ncbi:hypothetical protein BU15DRAFT_61626 [Melanogaster broomeanus]|nr:hypothetical protein BU15DRAFT_61626 [Melanogaster broomeanus]
MDLGGLSVLPKSTKLSSASTASSGCGTPSPCFSSSQLRSGGFFLRLRLASPTPTIPPLPDLFPHRIEIPEVNAGWRVGQHGRIRVLSSTMEWTGWAEVHPFTILTAAKTLEGLTLMSYEMAKVAGYGCEEGDMRRAVLSAIEGPYGGPGHAVFASCSAATFIAGGSGITFAPATVQNLVRVIDGWHQRDLEGSSRVKLIDLIWCIQDPCTPLFFSLPSTHNNTNANQPPSTRSSPYSPPSSNKARAPHSKISVHYERAADVLPAKDFLPGLTLTAGLPADRAKCWMRWM